MLVSFKKSSLQQKTTNRPKAKERKVKKNVIDVMDLLFCGFFTLIGLVVLGVGLIMVYSTAISGSTANFYQFPFVGGIIISFSAAVWVVQWGRKAIDACRSLIEN